MAKLLLVDDHPELAEVIRQLLEIQGHDVNLCDNAEAALTQLDRRGYQALITDDRLPGMSGVDLVRRVRSEVEHKSLYIAVCSADSTNAPAALKAGANAFWLKGSDALFEAVEKLSSSLAG